MTQTSIRDSALDSRCIFILKFIKTVTEGVIYQLAIFRVGLLDAELWPGRRVKVIDNSLQAAESFRKCDMKRIAIITGRQLVTGSSTGSAASGPLAADTNLA